MLGDVLRRARETLNRSPEQVGSLVGISGRTVRRLEDGESQTPRRVTLEALAGYYGLNPDVIVRLAEAPDADALLRDLREQTESLLGAGVTEALREDENEAVELAMRLSRLSGARADGLSPSRGKGQSVMAFLRSSAKRSPREYTEAVDAFVDFLALDSGRRTLAQQLLRDLHAAQQAERGGPPADT